MRFGTSSIFVLATLVIGCGEAATGNASSSLSATESLPVTAAPSPSASDNYNLLKLSEDEVEGRTSQEYDECVENSGGVTVSMRECSFAEHERFDVQLNRVYRATLEALPGEKERERLRASQRRWLAERDKGCDAETEEGTMALLMRDGCRLEELIRRVVWLEREHDAADQAAARVNTDPQVTTDWLIGTWGPAEHNPTNSRYSSCETDVIITFNPDGTYRDGGAYGNYKTDGRTITYSNRVLYDMIEDTEDRSEINQPISSKVSVTEKGALLENGEEWRRCVSS